MTYHDRTRYLLGLEFVGLGEHELQALDMEPIHQLPEGLPRGYGLWGGTGVGKSFALVRRMADLVENYVRLRPLPGTADLGQAGGLLWVNWPEKAEQVKRRVIGGAAEVHTFVERCKTTKWLVLDDLGKERLNGEDDYALGILAEVLDARYRSGKALWWTSNLSPTDLTGLYGSRLASRLLSTWPPFHVEGETDLRLRPDRVPMPAAARAAQVVDLRARAAGE